MRYTLIILALAFSGKLYSQYSSYYLVDQNLNANVNLNQNVAVSGHVSKTVTTIDYGALAQANAMQEANRLSAQRLAIERQQYASEVTRQNAILHANQAIEIAADPFKADTYGSRSSFKVSSSDPGWEGLERQGLVGYTESFTTPHTSLFQIVGPGRYENVSTEGIITEIIISNPSYNYRGLPLLSAKEMSLYYERIRKLTTEYKSSQRPTKKLYPNKEQLKDELFHWNQMCDELDNFGAILDPKDFNARVDTSIGTKIPVGPGDSVFVHKTESQKRTVYGNPGFRHTLIWEDDYNKCITDNYISYHNGITISVKVRYKADKSSNLTFEDLEGRRFYLIRFVDRHVAGRFISSPEYANPPRGPKRKNFKNFESWRKAQDRYNNAR